MTTSLTRWRWRWRWRSAAAMQCVLFLGGCVLFLVPLQAQRRQQVTGMCSLTGAACSAGVHRPSHVLLAMGHTEVTAQSSLRFSCGATTTESDIDFAPALVPAPTRLDVNLDVAPSIGSLPCKAAVVAPSVADLIAVFAKGAVGGGAGGSVLCMVGVGPSSISTTG